ncbi:MAG: hypothetical protein GX651_02990, partial [Methanomicrobiales archaeon]|nr:hypothetical protein [Methanomicrobiales archaeon]
IPLSPIDGRLVNFSYRPVGDFWLDQGYAWHYGYVNVTRGSSPSGADGALLSTPHQYATMENVSASPTLRKFATSLTGTESRPWFNSSTNASQITLSSVTFRPEPGAGYVSGNGIGTFALDAKVTETTYGVPELSSPNSITVYVNRVDPQSFPLAVYVQCNRSFADLAEKYPGNVRHSFESTPDYKMTWIEPVPGSLPFVLTHRQVAVNVSARG